MKCVCFGCNFHACMVALKYGCKRTPNMPLRQKLQIPACISIRKWLNAFVSRKRDDGTAGPMVFEIALASVAFI